MGVDGVLGRWQPARGEVVGGFSETAWAPGGAGGYVGAERAFLFALARPPLRLPLLKKAFALCYHAESVPHSASALRPVQRPYAAGVYTLRKDPSPRACHFQLLMKHL